MAGKLPFYPMYVDAFADGVIEMDCAGVGVYILALGHSWKHGHIPDSPDELARLIRQKPADVRRVWPQVRQKFRQINPGVLVNERQEQERLKAISKSEKATNAVRTRYSTSTDVDTNVPANVPANVPTDEHIRARTRSESESSGVSISEKEKNQEAKKLWLAAGFESPQSFEDWWLQVIENHPNRTKNSYAKSELFELIATRQFSRSEFEEGYSQLRESKADDWTKEAGKYCTNLYEIVHNRLWKFRSETKPNWVRELEEEQRQEQGARA